MNLEVGKIYTCHCVGGDFFVFDYLGRSIDGLELDDTATSFNFLCSNLSLEYAISNSWLSLREREIKEPTEFELEYYKYMRKMYYKEGQNNHYSEVTDDHYNYIVKIIKRKIKLDKI